MIFSLGCFGVAGLCIIAIIFWVWYNDPDRERRKEEEDWLKFTRERNSKK